MVTRSRALVVALSCAACGLGIVGVEPAGGDGGTSADAGSGPGLEASSDAAPLPDGTASRDGGVDASSGGPDGGGSDSGGGDDGGTSTPTLIAAAGTVAAPTGNAQQTHLVHAEKGKRWWLFTIASSAPSSLQAWSSADFVTWTQASDLALPRAHRGFGATFSVAYAPIGAHDIVHLGIGLAGTGDQKTHYHARAEVQGSAITWSALSGISDVNDPLLKDPEGEATVITAGGRVIDFTGWSDYSGAGTANENAFVSQAVDDGTPWTSGFGGHVDIATVPQMVNAHGALSLGGENLLALWESADTPEPDPLTVRSSRSSNTSTWSTAVAVFPETKFGVNDWGATALAANDVHAVRLTTSFEHRRFDGTSWRTGDPIPALPGGGRKNAGLVVLHDGTRVSLAAIAADSSIQLTRWSAGAWSAWTPVVAAAGSRSALSGWQSSGAGIGLVWTETDGTGAHVVGVRLTH